MSPSISSLLTPRASEAASNRVSRSSIIISGSGCGCIGDDKPPISGRRKSQVHRVLQVGQLLPTSRIHDAPCRCAYSAGGESSRVRSSRSQRAVSGAVRVALECPLRGHNLDAGIPVLLLARKCSFG